MRSYLIDGGGYDLLLDPLAFLPCASPTPAALAVCVCVWEGGSHYKRSASPPLPSPLLSCVAAPSPQLEDDQKKKAEEKEQWKPENHWREHARPCWLCWWWCRPSSSSRVLTNLAIFFVIITVDVVATCILACFSLLGVSSSVSCLVTSALLLLLLRRCTHTLVLWSVACLPW